MLRLISLLSIIVLIPANAMAIEINKEGAATLKTSFQNLLDYQKSSNEAFGNIGVIYEGELTIEQKADYYTITLPHTTFKSLESENQTAEFTFDIGVITIDIAPNISNDGYWKSIISFPSTMTLSDNSNEDDLVIEFKEQKAIALFNERLGYFTKIEADFSGINIKEDGQDIGLNIAGIQFYMNLTENENSSFFGPAHILIKGLNITPNEDKNNIKLGELKLDFSMTDLILPTLSDYNDKFIKHADTFRSLGNLEQDASIESIDGANVISMITDLYNFEIDGFSVQYNIKDLEIIPDATNNEREFDSFKVDSAFLGFALNGLNAEKGMFNIKTGYDNFKITPPNPEYKDILPQSANFDIKAENIPYNMLYKLTQNSMESVIKNPDMAYMLGLGILMKLPAILSQSDTKITIAKNGIKNDIYDLTLDGEIVTDLTAIMSFAAKFRAVFSGLDNLLYISKQHAANDENENSTEFISLTKTLETIKRIGVNEPTTNGKSAYIFDFETTPQGSLLINGNDISTISFD